MKQLNIKLSFFIPFIFSGIIGMAKNPEIHGVLRVNPANSRYFTDDSGKAIYLTGSHTWNVLVDQPDLRGTMDFNSYLSFMKSYGHNFLRMWTIGVFLDHEGKDSPLPYMRTGPGTSPLDGNLKFDLSQLNKVYFDRLRTRVVAAKNQGIYVSIMLFEGWDLFGWNNYSPDGWAGYPENPANNINGINVDRLSVYSLSNSKLVNLQKAYIKKVINTVNDLDNVMYEIINEGGCSTVEWQYEMINYIKSYESSLAKQHPVGMTFRYHRDMTYRGNNTELFNSPADWISPNDMGGYKTPVTATSNGSKVIISDTDHLWGIGGDQKWVWESFCRGMNVIFMDTYSPPKIPVDAQWDPVRKSMGQALLYANKMNLATMTPQNSLGSTTYCLANPGQEYLVYQPDSDSFTVNLLAGTYSYEWFNPNISSVVSIGSMTTSDGSHSFTPPFSGDAVIYLKKASGDTTPQAAPGGLIVH